MNSDTRSGNAPHGGELKERIFPEEKEKWHELLSQAKRITLNQRQQCDVELLLVGGFSPLEGFLTKEEYNSVLTDMRLPNGELWPMSITLDLPAPQSDASRQAGLPGDTDVSEGEEVLLCDKYGTPIAAMEATSVFTPDKVREAEYVFGTTNTEHYGVKKLYAEYGDVYVGGPVWAIAQPHRPEFAELHATPRELQAYFQKAGLDRVVGFQTRNPIHRAHHALIKRAAEDAGGHVLIHPAVGETKAGDIDPATRVRIYKTVKEKYCRDFASVSVLPLAMRMAGPREALWHAIIRKNYGCTHFIVGRDHAGPGKDANGNPFYGDYDAQELVKEYEEELGISLVTPREYTYVVEEDAHLPIDELKPHHTTRHMSGTELRRMLEAGEEIPEWLSFPEVVTELKHVYRANGSQKGVVLFFTGLSGAGKSTIARIVSHTLQETYDRAVTFLDGDVIRQHLSKGLGFSQEDRNTNIERIGFVAGEVARHGGIVICSAIAPYAEARAKNRARVTEVGGTYIEIFVSTPLSVCQDRDPKGLYQKAHEGALTGMTGVDDPYEAPEAPELVIDASAGDPEEAAQEIISFLFTSGVLQE